jgi:hypothetical protein
VSAGWAAGSVRARAIARRRVGAEKARQIAASDSLHTALRLLVAGPTDRGTRPGQTLASAQHAVTGAVLWDLRVLAGWLPAGGSQLMRPLAGWFEIANIDELVQRLAGRPAGDYFELGALATAWLRLQDAGSIAQLRAVLARSAWKDPGGDSERVLRVGVRARWAVRVAAVGEPARTWAAAAVAVMLADERFAEGRTPQPALRGAAAALLGEHSADAASLEELRESLPRRLAWALEGVASPADLWQAETAWWDRVERDGVALVRTAAFDFRPVLGAAAVLAADARRVRAALELAARGGGPLEAYDAMA